MSKSMVGSYDYDTERPCSIAASLCQLLLKSPKAEDALLLDSQVDFSISGVLADA